MSTRLGIELLVEPAFTARAYRARQIICGQYASWAAEMHMLHVGMVSYFQCSDMVVDLLAHGVARLADESRRRSPRFAINCRGVANGRNGNAGANGQRGGIYLDFQQTDKNHPMTVLRRDAMALIDGLPGAAPPPESGEFRPKISLMEHAHLPSAVMADASDFAKGVAIDVGVPAVARAWRLVLLRYHSEAAGDDWTDGRWAPDLRWEHLSSYVL